MTKDDRETLKNIIRDQNKKIQFLANALFDFIYVQAPMQGRELREQFRQIEFTEEKE